MMLIPTVLGLIVGGLFAAVNYVYILPKVRPRGSVWLIVFLGYIEPLLLTVLAVYEAHGIWRGEF
jgi:hypothetical protein